MGRVRCIYLSKRVFRNAIVTTKTIYHIIDYILWPNDCTQMVNATEANHTRWKNRHRGGRSRRWPRRRALGRHPAGKSRPARPPPPEGCTTQKAFPDKRHCAKATAPQRNCSKRHRGFQPPVKKKPRLPDSELKMLK